jgi:hypothetical protein
MPQSDNSFRIVAITTDLTHRLSEGASTTNAIELVAREICERFQIRPRDLVMIKHCNWRGTENALPQDENAEHFEFVDCAGVEEREDWPARNG